MIKGKNILAKISVIMLIAQSVIVPLLSQKASAAMVTLTPLTSLSAADIAQLDVLSNPGAISPPNKSFVTSNDYTPALSPAVGTPSPGTVTEKIIADQDNSEMNAKVVFAPFDVPVLPTCVQNIVVKATSAVSVDSNTDNDSDGNASASMGFLDINDMGWAIGAGTVLTHNYNVPVDYGSPAVTLSFTSTPITAAQYNAARFYLVMDGSATYQDPVVERDYSWKDVSLDVTYDSSACNQADLKVTSSVPSGATTIMPGKCEVVEVTLENLGPDDSSYTELDLISYLVDTNAFSSFTLTSQPTAPTGAVQEIDGVDISTYTPTTTINSPAVYSIDNIPAGESVVISMNVCASSSATIGQSIAVGGDAARTEKAIDPDSSNNDDGVVLSVVASSTTGTTTTTTTVSETTLPNAGHELIIEALIAMMIMSSVLYIYKKSYSY